MSRFLFRADAAPSLGLGHFKRVLTLAQSFEGEKILILRTDDEKLAEEAEDFFSEVHTFPVTFSILDELNFLKNLEDEHKAIVFDISNPLSYSKVRDLPKLLAFYKKMGKVAVIDGLGKDSLIHHCPELDCEFLITPYVGAQQHTGTFTHLFGEKYYILNESFRNKNYELRKEASKILITMGGSDPTDLTHRIVSALLPLPGIQLRVVLGPLYTNEQERSLNELLKSPNNISQVRSPKDMAQEYLESDLVISASGLSKYELAALGVPMMLVSRNKEMHDVNEAFVKVSGCVDLGLIDELQSISFIDQLKRLLVDYDVRKKMSQTSRTLIDGKGCERIFSCLNH